MSKQAYKRVRRALKLEVNRKPLDAYAWPGGYPIFYVLPDISTLSGTCCYCPKCANENIDSIDAELKELARGNGRAARKSWGGFIGADVNYEDDSLTCDYCGDPIESAYGAPADDEERAYGPHGAPPSQQHEYR